MTQTPLNLLLFDADPMFQLGFITTMKQESRVKKVKGVETKEAVFQLLKTEAFDLLIFDLPCQSLAEIQQFAHFCREVKQISPQLPLFLLSHSLNRSQLQQVQNLGIQGYGTKGMKGQELLAILAQVVAGNSDWGRVNLTDDKIIAPLLNQSFLVRLYASGVQQIQQQIFQIEFELQSSQLSRFDRQFLQGRKRELKTALWCVNKIFLQNRNSQDLEPFKSKKIKLNSPIAKPSLAKSKLNHESSLLPFPSLVNLDQGGKAIQPLVENTLQVIQAETEIRNCTDTLLELDILKPYLKKELLYLVLRQLYHQLEEARLMNLSLEELDARQDLILVKVWQETTLNFYQNHWGNQKTEQQRILQEQLNQDAEEIKQEILQQIPFIQDLFQYWVFQSPLLIDQVPYSFNTPEAQARAELILQNLILKIANGVLQFTLNHVSESDALGYKLYHSRYYSTREMAKFRNRISGQYRQKKLWLDPQQIFESRYSLYAFNQNNITSILIESPRQKELENLQGFPWLVTIALELRDAIAPVLQGIISFLGKGLVYILTQIIGKGLGLIGKGILQGIGYRLQESKK